MKLASHRDRQTLPVEGRLKNGIFLSVVELVGVEIGDVSSLASVAAVGHRREFVCLLPVLCFVAAHTFVLARPRVSASLEPLHPPTVESRLGYRVRAKRELPWMWLGKLNLRLHSRAPERARRIVLGA